MFDSLKSKMKSFFSKVEKHLDEEKVYKPEELEQKPFEPVTVTPALATSEKILETVAPEAASEPVGAPKLSRKEILKLKKQEKKESKRIASVSSVVSDSGKKIKEDPLDEILDELKIILLEADVAYPVVEEIKNGVRENLVGRKYDRSYTLEQVVKLVLKDAIRNVMKINEFDFDGWLVEQKRPTVIMFVGINGTGKTTAIAKIAKRIQDQDMTVVMAACDTFRAGAIEQLTIHSEKLGCKIVK